MHENARLFNEGVPMMEAIAKHLEMFSLGLFEEIMRIPYDENCKTKKAIWQNDRLKKRKERYK